MKANNSNQDSKKKFNLKNVLIAILIIIIVILLFRSCGTDSNKGPNIEQAGLVENIEVPNVNPKGYTSLPVIDDFSVSKDNPYITLYNPEANTGCSYLQYRFTNIDTGEVIYESGLVNPGHKFSVAFGEMLETGEYNVLVEILNFDYDDYTVRKNGGQSEIIVTVN